MNLVRFPWAARDAQPMRHLQRHGPNSQARNLRGQNGHPTRTTTWSTIITIVAPVLKLSGLCECATRRNPRRDAASFEGTLWARATSRNLLRAPFRHIKLLRFFQALWRGAVGGMTRGQSTLRPRKTRCSPRSPGGGMYAVLDSNFNPDPRDGDQRGRHARRSRA